MITPWLRRAVRRGQRSCCCEPSRSEAHTVTRPDRAQTRTIGIAAQAVQLPARRGPAISETASSQQGDRTTSSPIPTTTNEGSPSMQRQPRIRVGRVYDHRTAEDGARVLVDRLWPRGLTKDQADLDEWCKQI